MDTFKDILSSLRDWIRDRASNPLFAAFLISWLILNWRVVLILFDDGKAIDKIRLLDRNFFPACWHWLYYGFISPLCLAILYVIISPHVFRKATIYYREQQHKSKNQVLSVDKLEPVSPDDAERLKHGQLNAKRALRAATVRFQGLEDGYLEEIQTLRTALETVRTSRKEPPLGMSMNTKPATSDSKDPKQGSEGPKPAVEPPPTPVYEPVIESAAKSNAEIPVADVLQNIDTTIKDIVGPTKEKVVTIVKGGEPSVRHSRSLTTTTKDSLRFQKLLSKLDSLSNTATQYLKLASQTKSGEIRVIKEVNNRRSIHIGDNVTVTIDAAHRKQVDGLAAIAELLEDDLIELANNGLATQVYVVTSEGYEISDILRD